jgi:hypothetical protein
MKKDRKDIIEKILDGSSTRLRESYFNKNYPSVLSEINTFCEDLNISLKEKLWYWVNDIDTQFLCKCGNVTTFNKNWLDGYRQSCSPKCSQSSNVTKEKRKNTNLEKYGVDNVAKNDIIKKKTVETNLVRYGTKSSFQNNDVKEKWKSGLIEKYGVDHISKLESTKSKSRDTCLERYGKEHYTQTEDFLNKSINTNLEKYGKMWYTQTDEYTNKSNKTHLEKYGCHYSSTYEFKNKVNITNNIKYNVDWYTQSREFKEKKKISNIDKYGVDHHTKAESYNQNIKLVNINKYGVDNIQKNEIYRKERFDITKNIFYIKYIGNTISLFNCDCNKKHTFEIYVDNYIKRTNSNIPLCTVCYPIGDMKSIKEKELLEFIKSIYSGEIISSYRDGLEIDIYLPEFSLGFEFNGLYWHSNKFKDKNYHLNKTNYFKEKGIRIIHIWEDDYNTRLEIIKSQIKNLLKINSRKIFARKCSAKIVSIKESKQFLDNNHIQGSVASSIKIGLYFENELVSLMTFNTSEGRKKMEEGGYNLNRFCNLSNTNVVGGASKLLSHFNKIYNPTRIVSYADKDWSIGNLYEVLGFTNTGGNGPDYKYIVDGCRVHKSRYKKDKLNLKDKENTTESQEMLRRGIYKIYDCGKIKFEKIN